MYMPTRPSTDTLQLESFRVTLFKSTQRDPDVSLFASLLGQSPIKSQIVNLPVKTIMSDGIVEGIRFTIEDSMLVINIVFYGTDQVNPVDGTLLHPIGFDESLEIVSRLWDKVQKMTDFFGTPRIAIAPVYFIPVEDKLVGYETISSYLPFVVNGQTASDFLFQINQPVEKMLPTGSKYVLNNVIQISVAVISSVSVALAITGLPTFLPKEVFRARLQFDANNAPNSLLDKASATAVYKESLASVMNVLQNGISL